MSNLKLHILYQATFLFLICGMGTVSANNWLNSCHAELCNSLHAHTLGDFCPLSHCNPAEINNNHHHEETITATFGSTLLYQLVNPTDVSLSNHQLSEKYI